MYDLKEFLRANLTGTALLWLNCKEDQINDFDDFIRLFVNNFWGELKQGKVREKLYFGKFDLQRNNLSNYALQLYSQVQYLEPSISETEIVMFLSRHYKPEICETIALQNICKFDQLLAYLSRVERNLDRNSNNSNFNKNSNRQTANHNVGDNNNLTNNQNRVRNNYNNNNMRRNYGNNQYENYSRETENRNFNRFENQGNNRGNGNRNFNRFGNQGNNREYYNNNNDFPRYNDYNRGNYSAENRNNFNHRNQHSSNNRNDNNRGNNDERGENTRNIGECNRRIYLINTTLANSRSRSENREVSQPVQSCQDNDTLGRSPSETVRGNHTPNPHF